MDAPTPPSDLHRVQSAAVSQMIRTPEGRQAWIAALRAAAWGFEDNAHEYEQTGAFDWIEQLRLAGVARQMAEQAEAEPAAYVPTEDIPF